MVNTTSDWSVKCIVLHKLIQIFISWNFEGDKRRLEQLQLPSTFFNDLTQ